MSVLRICNKIIEFSFYGLFLLVPLVFSNQTSELFEFNKMWLAFALALFILTAWAIKMVVLKKFFIQRTPLDIPIVLFLLSQIVSTFISLDSYVSFWGYYSRFNGGLLSTISYIVLYYAFLSNFSLIKRGELWHEERTNYPSGNIFSKLLSATQNDQFRNKVGELRADEATSALTMVKRLLGISLISGVIVALWGLPSHFGFDPTCFVFRGNFDVSCWTQAFQPKVRIFSTLGQPAWLGAYLALLIPFGIAMLIQNSKVTRFAKARARRESQNLKGKLLITIYFLLPILFYLALLFTKSRAALIAIWISIAVFAALYFFKKFQLNKKFIIHNSKFIILLIILLATTLLSGFPIELSRGKSAAQTGGLANPGGGGTDSGQIRLIVWKGALEIFKHNPLFGSGVETFAFSYYKYRPAEHNLTSEWNYLYNKAHNEYLNFLATTGVFGLGSYLLMIGTFMLVVLKKLLNNRTIEQSNNRLPIIALISSYISILITDFFGFSVVITNLYFFLIPAFAFVLLGNLPKMKIGEPKPLGIFQKLDILVILAASFYLLSFLLNFYLADISYSAGANLSQAQEFDKAYPFLKDAVLREPFEPTYKDELAQNDSLLSLAIAAVATNEAKLRRDLEREAVAATTQVTDEHPNNVVFWKSKVRVFYTLAQIDPKYNKFALEAIQKAQSLAPTDASISYNLALLEGQEGQTQKAVETLEKTVKLKPNYESARYALGLYYHSLGENEKAKAQMEYILKNLDSNNQGAKDALKSFGN